jgi:hypothetical protein
VLGIVEATGTNEGCNEVGVGGVGRPYLRMLISSMTLSRAARSFERNEWV